MMIMLMNHLLLHSLLKTKQADYNTSTARIAFFKLLTYSTSEVISNVSVNPTVGITINNKIYETGVAAVGLDHGYLSTEDFHRAILKVIQKIWSEVYSDPLIPTGLTMAQYNAANTAWDNSMKFELIQDLAITGVVDVSTLLAND